MKIKNGRATIREVATAAGVSIQTVSRVINEKPDVSPETRKRVKEVVDQLGYQPSELARSLIHQRSYTLGVVTAGLAYIGPSRTLSGITCAAEAAGYAILLKELSSFDTDAITPIFQAFLSRHVDGIIWAVPEVGDNRKWVQKLSHSLEIPIVFLTMKAQENISVVSINNFLGGRMATTHLLEQGYRSIAHISGPLDWWESRQRMNGWKDAMADAGTPTTDLHWVEGDWSSESGAQAAATLFEKYPAMDAVFAANDQMALGLIQALNQRSLKVPEQCGVVGFDNIAESAFFCPPLSSVHQDLSSLGKIAVEETLKIIEAGWQGDAQVDLKSIMLTPLLIVRKSSLK